MCEDPNTTHPSSILAMCEMIPALKHFAIFAMKSETQNPAIMAGSKTLNLRTTSDKQSSVRGSVRLTFILYFSGKYFVSFLDIGFWTWNNSPTDWEAKWHFVPWLVPVNKILSYYDPGAYK